MTAGEIAEATVVVCNGFNEPHHDPNCRREHLRLRYAHQQKGFDVMPDMHFWHVMSEGPMHHSTLSMDGIRSFKAKGLL